MQCIKTPSGNSSGSMVHQYKGKVHNRGITAHTPPPPTENLQDQIHRGDTRMWVRFATTHKLTAAGQVAVKMMQLWVIIIPDISHLHALL